MRWVPEDRIRRACFAGHSAASISREDSEIRSTEVLINRLETQPTAHVVLLSPHDVRLQEKKREEYLDQKSGNRDSRKQGHEAVVRTASMKTIVQVCDLNRWYEMASTALTPRHGQICDPGRPRLRASFHNREF